jgi:hypothetical protein
MALSIFEDKANPPTLHALETRLGDAHPGWQEFLAWFTQRVHHPQQEWKYYSKKSGWGLVLKDGSRTITYLYPQDKRFTAVFVYGEKAVAASRAAGLPGEILELIESAKAYAEGRSFHVPVQANTDPALLTRLGEIKLAN